MLMHSAKQIQDQIEVFNETSGQSSAEFEKTIELHHYRTLWTYLVNCILGLWLITGPFLYDYQSPALAGSDIVSGALIILFELLSFSPGRVLLRLCTPVVAIWLLFAPLVFWSPTPAAFLIDTLIACLVIAFSILLPGVPGKGGREPAGPDIPPGWTYNPSSWIRRWLGIALALVGFFLSRYLAAHQLGYIHDAWDPFFGSGTDKVTESVVSRSFPISDAGFGSVAYIMETLTGFMGGRARWRTAPWITVMFVVLVLPLGVTSIVLVVLQPIVVGAWCGFCLISAAALLASVPLAVHEGVAVGLLLFEAGAQKKNVWQVFWTGASIVGYGTKDPDRMCYSLGQRWTASVQGVTVPWSIAAQLAIGIWLMLRPAILPSVGITANSDYMLGAMVVTVAAVATAEVTRMFRFVNLLLGFVLIVVAFLFAGRLPLICVSDFVSGIILIIVSLPLGPIVERYARWDKFVR